ncbi:putative secondary metabolism biosynthetic enzyme [Exophiala dermatitidis]|uniref:Enoyl-CoA hydratase n=2 Tax=Exophiala dermatitidis TaxID=5970 RepID=H6C6Q0_EXODN|nr:enoyl-CoA hydratase [Exophiala dermatitidis NIH/UT8656]KAJ4526138.1 putative secondary metabolism biosynthetic enzyme [Exophiala dermatitidis]EHY59396.1 enoyl-CoA hydratase [Exophiala dermatitidis NIH/UT8656]KAJ4526917.1 putative secondary metabolism biosynthetic enzyme [Exophiala dermatitidis]KAJ4532630.1 putative secondary metabolism biosynthetic enzyme [Exophiala dermatitidis]KAJ4546858.1 putative secondary metabolism biosynthetic enzyme [Exophiala dermatitidis]
MMRTATATSAAVAATAGRVGVGLRRLGVNHAHVCAGVGTRQLGLGTSQRRHQFSTLIVNRIAGAGAGAGFGVRYMTTTTSSGLTSSNNHDGTDDDKTKGKGDILCDVRPILNDILAGTTTNTDTNTNGDTGTVATITISHARRLNSLNSHLITKLTNTLYHLSDLRYYPDLRCVVIRGATSPSPSNSYSPNHSQSPTRTYTPSFSSGADIHEMSDLSTPAEAKHFITHLHKACHAIRCLPVITIAKIDGLCFGGGLELAASCDFRYATARSTFGMPETRYGIPSVIEARLLANIVGWQRTRELVYFAKSDYSAQKMLEWGLIDEVCDDAEALEKGVDEKVRLIAKNGPIAMRVQKSLVREWEECGTVNEGVEKGIEAFARMWVDGGAEPRRYMREFTERKKREKSEGKGERGGGG